MLAARIFAACWIFLLLLIVMLGAARLALWLSYEAVPDSGWLMRAILRGGRYDFAIGSVLTLFVLLLTLPLLALPERIARIAPNLAFVQCTALFGASTLLSIVEYFYYGFYHTRIDPVVFGVFEDDTAMVVDTVWNDYPIVTVLLVVAALLFLAYKALRWASGRLGGRLPLAGYKGVGLAVVQVLVFALLARGSLGTFPLVRQDLMFARDPFLNQIVLNAPLTLYRAYRTRSQDIDLGADPRAGLVRWGFATPQDAAAVLGMHGDDAQIADALFAHVPARSDTPRHPHVVLALLESFGTDLLDADGGDNDLLGRLRPHLSNDYFFPKFFAAQNGTHGSVEALLLGSPITPLTRDRYGDVTYPTSMALPFREAGYRTVLIYAGSASWRNLRHTFLRQGFDHVYDAVDIRANVPAAQSNDLGRVYDRYVYTFVQDLLTQAERDGKPLFLFMLTTTNHPPFEVPPGARTQFDMRRVGARATTDTSGLRRMLATYRYQADEFGGFMDWVTQGPLRDRTVVAAAGDHNLRSHYDYALPQEQPDVDRVFGYLRVPDAYRPAQVDTQRFAGHADIMPTLATLALPGGRYVNFGRDLLAPGQSDDYALARFQWLYRPEGVLKAPARPAFHAWSDPAKRRIEANGRAPSASDAAVARRVAARVALQDWLIRRSALGAGSGGAAP